MNAEQYAETESKLNRAKSLRGLIQRLERAVETRTFDLHGKDDGLCPVELEDRDILSDGWDFRLYVPRYGKSTELAEAILPVLQKWLEEAKAELEAL